MREARKAHQQGVWLDSSKQENSTQQQQGSGCDDARAKGKGGCNRVYEKAYSAPMPAADPFIRRAEGGLKWRQ